MSLLGEQGRALDFAAHVTAAAFLGPRAAFALGDGTVRLVDPDGEQAVEAHDGACLEAMPLPRGAALLTCGDDGRLVRTGADGKREVLAETGGKWIDHVAASPAGAIAWSAGKRVFARIGGAERVLDLPSSPGGLAFAPKGTRLAAAHYNGATLWYPNAREAEPHRLDWKGAHARASFSPDGRFLVTTMQENALHGWRLSDGLDMRMTGYPSKVRDLAWSPKGRWLATTGAQASVLWPFDKDGPMGREPRQIGAREHVTTAAACHPSDDVLASGFADGMILLIRIADGAEVLAAEAGGGAVTSIAWSAKGERLAFGTEDGRAGLIVL